MRNAYMQNKSTKYSVFSYFETDFCLKSESGPTPPIGIGMQNMCNIFDFELGSDFEFNVRFALILINENSCLFIECIAHVLVTSKSRSSRHFLQI